jgi:hypothetical protein
MKTDKKWVGSWSTSPARAGIHIPPLIHLDNGLLFSTSRSIIRPTLSGDSIRLNLSNVYSRKPLHISETTVAEYLGGKADTGKAVNITFGGKKEVTIPAGGEVLSDPVEFKVEALKKIAVSFYVKHAVMRTKGLYGADTYLSPGNCTHKEKYTPWWHLHLKVPMAHMQTIPFLTRVDVLAEDNCYAIVVAGDSTVTNEKPYLLAERLQKMGIHHIAVLQQAIAGNRILENGHGIVGNLYGAGLLERFGRDILSCPGVKKIILKEGINDMLHPRCLTVGGPVMTTAKDITEGLQKAIDLAHKNNLEIYLSKLTPFKGWGKLLPFIDDFTWTRECQDIVDETNEWIDSCNAEGIINVDFIKDENDSEKMKEEYSIDMLHYNLKAQEIFADSIDESFLL